MNEINETEKYIKTKYYPKESNNVIKEQKIILNNDVYIITFDGIEWRLFLAGKQIVKSKDHNKIYEKIPKE